MATAIKTNSDSHATAGRPKKNRPSVGPISARELASSVDVSWPEASRWELLTDASNEEWADIISDIAAADVAVARTDVLKAIRQRKRGAQGASVLDDCPEGEYRTIVINQP